MIPLLLRRITMIALLSTPAHAVELDYETSGMKEQVGSLWISGRIESGDADKVINWWDDFKGVMLEYPNGFPEAESLTPDTSDWGEVVRSLPMIKLNSEGGDVYEAMKLGRHLRKNQMTAAVGSAPSRCYSSCVLVLAGAANRYVFGQIGLHAPFATGEVTSEQVKQLRHDVRDYLEEMGISLRVFDLMMNTPSDRMRILDGGVSKDVSTLEELGLFGKDGVYADRQLTFAAKGRGVSKEEFVRIESIVSECIGTYQAVVPEKTLVPNCVKLVWSRKRLPTLKEVSN